MLLYPTVRPCLLGSFPSLCFSSGFISSIHSSNLSVSLSLSLLVGPVFLKHTNTHPHSPLQTKTFSLPSLVVPVFHLPGLQFHSLSFILKVQPLVPRQWPEFLKFNPWYPDSGLSSYTENIRAFLVSEVRSSPCFWAFSCHTTHHLLSFVHVLCLVALGSAILSRHTCLLLCPHLQPAPSPLLSRDLLNLEACLFFSCKHKTLLCVLDVS